MGRAWSVGVAVVAIIAMSACTERKAGERASETSAPPPSKDAAAAPEAIDPAQACAVDADCGARYEMYIDKPTGGSCCRNCNTQPVARAWLAQAARECEAMGSAGCPEHDCEPLEPVECRAGKCRVARPSE